MGLEAVVYRSVTNLPQGFPLDQLRTDDVTGETYFKDSRPADISHDFAVAKKHFLGNIAEIGASMQEVSLLLGEDSCLVKRVLYSGSHSGDIIGLEDLADLESELITVESCDAQLSTELLSIALKLRELVSEARMQGNPIVFV